MMFGPGWTVCLACILLFAMARLSRLRNSERPVLSRNWLPGQSAPEPAPCISRVPRSVHRAVCGSDSGLRASGRCSGHGCFDGEGRSSRLAPTVPTAPPPRPRPGTWPAQADAVLLVGWWTASAGLTSAPSGLTFANSDESECFKHTWVNGATLRP